MPKQFPRPHWLKQFKLRKRNASDVALTSSEDGAGWLAGVPARPGRPTTAARLDEARDDILAFTAFPPVKQDE